MLTKSGKITPIPRYVGVERLVYPSLTVGWGATLTLGPARALSAGQLGRPDLQHTAYPRPRTKSGAVLPKYRHTHGANPYQGWGPASGRHVWSRVRRARFGLNLVSNSAPYNQQTSTKLLEYCAVGLPVVTNDYAWVRYFAAHHNANFHVLRDDPSTWPHSFGGALEAYPYGVPDMRTLAWPQLLQALPLWKHLHIV